MNVHRRGARHEADWETTMKRRSFLAGAGVAGVAAAASTLAAPAIAQGKRELKMVTTWPKNFPGLGTAAQRMADVAVGKHSLVAAYVLGLFVVVPILGILLIP
jgi:hypothetical protein